MNTTIQQVTEIFERLNEQDQNFAMNLLIRLEKSNELEKRLRNSEYLDKVQRAIDQIEQGKGVIRDIIEVSEDD